MKERVLFILGIVLLTNFRLIAQTKIWSLKDCITYATDNNITIKKSELDKNTINLNYKQLQYNRLPNLAGTATGTFSNGATIDPITNQFANQQILSNNFGLSGQVVLTQGNTLNLQIQKNKILLQKSELYIQETKNSVVLSILEAYLQALYYHEGIAIAENTIKSSQEELKQTQVKFDNGAIAFLELSSIKTQNATNEYNLVTAQNQYAQQVLLLKQLLELEPSTEFEIENIPLDNIEIIIPDKQDVFTKAIQFLPDLKIYDLAKQSLEKDVKIARAAYFPTLSLGYSINSGYTSTLDYDYGTQLKNNFKQQAGLTLSVPIFSKLEERTKIRLANIQLQQNELDKLSASKSLYSKIETIYQNAIANAAQASSSKVTRDNAKLSYELASKKFELGGLTATELAVTRNTYLNAEQTNLQNKYLSILYQQLLSFYQAKSVTEIK